MLIRPTAPRLPAIAWSCLAGTIAGLLCAAPAARADQSLANFNSLSQPSATAEAEMARNVVDPWGAVPTDKISLVNLAPGLIPYFNNGPAFGLPGTVTGDFWDRTQLTGDWGGLRTDWAKKGVFVDLYSTSYFQDVTSGGIETDNTFVQNTQLAVNIDTGRAGLWSGGLFHLSLLSRYGALPADTFTAGGAVPQYIGLSLPGPTFANDTLPSEYFLAQALSKKVSVVIGKISDIYIPDETLFGNSYKYYFSNFNFNKNPMTVNFYNPTAWAALGVVTPTDWLAVAGGVLDPYSESDNFAENAFRDGANLYLTSVMSYKLGGLPGQFSPAFNWSNQPQVDLANPYGALVPAEIPQALGGLLGVNSTAGLPVNYDHDSWFAIANFSQYLYVADDAATVARKLRSGEVINGLGVAGRIGYAPEATNTITTDASIELVGHGLWDKRPYDSFGVGFYYNGVSGDLKSSIARMTAGTVNVKDETGVEMFYDLAITPAVRLIPGFQHIWNPLIAQVADQDDHTDIVTLKLTTAW